MDIYDLNYDFTSEKLGILNLPPENNPKRGIFIRILSLFKNFVFTISLKRKKIKVKKKQIVFFCYSQQ